MRTVKTLIGQYKKDGDVVIVSVHWGSNWGWTIDKGVGFFSETVYR